MKKLLLALSFLTVSVFADWGGDLNRLSSGYTGTTVAYTNNVFGSRIAISSVLVVTDTAITNECQVKLVTVANAKTPNIGISTNLLVSTEGAVTNFTQMLVVFDGIVQVEKNESIQIVNSNSNTYRVFITPIFP